MIVLTSVSRMYATKRIRQDRKTGKLIKTPYGLEKYFEIKTVDLSGFADLCRCLERLTQRPFAFVIRGAPLPGIDLKKARRLLHDDAATGDVATFTEAPRHWFAVDIDKVRCPVAIDPVSDPDGAIEHLIRLLPPELADASCWWQFTCSQSLPGYENLLSARLWFWLRELLDSAALTRWSQSANKAAGGTLIDPSLYRAVQPHYVADPIFEDGMRDPLPRRHGIRLGLDQAVSLVIPEPSATDPYVGGDGYVGLGIEGHLTEIGGDRGFRAPMVSAIAAYFTVNGAETNPEPIKQRVREAIDRADPGNRSEADLARYRSDRHLNDVVGWIRARERANPKPVRSPQTSGEFLESLGRSVPIGSERVRAVREITRHLFRQRFLNIRLASSLVEAWNAAHCIPPLSQEQVNTIVAAAAARALRQETGKTADHV
jgi:hypothetical protein